MGGPGSGKGTQSLKLAKEYGFVHLSAGDLLREEKNSGSDTAAMINTYIKEGKIVPGEVTVGLMKKAIEKNGLDQKKYLIDGFPRNKENLEIWQRILGEDINVPFILFLEANEDAMIERIIERAKTSGRVDDNMDSLKNALAYSITRLYLMWSILINLVKFVEFKQSALLMGYLKMSKSSSKVLFDDF